MKLKQLFFFSDSLKSFAFQDGSPPKLCPENKQLKMLFVFHEKQGQTFPLWFKPKKLSCRCKFTFFTTSLSTLGEQLASISRWGVLLTSQRVFILLLVSPRAIFYCVGSTLWLWGYLNGFYDAQIKGCVFKFILGLENLKTKLKS